MQSDLVLVLFLIVSQVSLRGYTLKLLHDLQIGKKNYQIRSKLVQLVKTIEPLQIPNRLSRIEEAAMASVKKVNFDEL